MSRLGFGCVLVAFTTAVGGIFAAPQASARESGIQGTPDGKRILVNKDVGAERYAIAQDQDDRSATGNVFFTDARSPAFLLCSAAGGTAFSCAVADPCPTSGRQSGIQRRPDGKGVLVSKDVGGERYAITANADDGSLTGNVFFTDGRPPVFLYCQSLGGTAYSCSGADRCSTTTCAPYSFLANITLPQDFFTVPDGCPSFQDVGSVDLPGDFFSVPSTTRGPLAVSARQVVGNNPFGGFSKSAGAGSASASLRRTRAVHAASTSRDETFDCIGGGTRNFQCQVGKASDGSSVTTSLLAGNDCAFPQNNGGLTIENGSVYTAIPDFADCDPLPFLAGIEQLEERDPLVFDFVDANGFTTLRQSDESTRLVTYGAACVNSAGTSVSSEQVRDLNGELDTALFGDGEVHFLESFDHVDQAIEYSPEPECAPTYTLFTGTTTTADGRTGEVYTTTYGLDGGLQYTLEDSVLQIAGGLTSECSGSQSSFSFRTIQAPLFDPADPDGCPRDGRIEISSNGSVIGQVVFTPSGGVQLIEADGRTTSFASCNDGGLLLQCE
jgi:hypothetical protein